MSIKVSQAFERTSANPIDETIALTKAQMLTVNDNLMPDYYFTICQDDGNIYLYNKNATPSATTGKFTKFEGGGGGGGGGASGSMYTSTLTVAGWNATTKQQTVTFTDYDDSYNGVIGVPSDATDAQRVAYAEAKISTVSQSGSTVVVKAENIPSIALPIAIYCGGGGSGSGVPAGGTTGQVLAKRSNTDGDVEWKNDSAGHEILDTDSTSMTQRTKLQFEGLDVTDDSTNDITKVSGVGLNSDSLDDITSATIPGNMFTGSGFNYSTTEQIVGRWIDGKPLYQKTLVIPSAAPNAIVYLDTELANVEWAFKVQAHLTRTVSSAGPRLNEFWNSASDFVSITLNAGSDGRWHTRVACPNSWTDLANITITCQYTKTTD